MKTDRPPFHGQSPAPSANDRADAERAQLSAECLHLAETAVKRWNLRGRLRPHPRGRTERRCLEQLAFDGVVQWMPATATSLGGWHWVGGARRVR